MKESREIDVVEVDVARTYELRRAVLREGRPDANVQFPEDDEPGTFHLAAVDVDGTVVAIASFNPETTSARPGASAVRLRGMAVTPMLQGHGIGARLLDAAVTRLRSSGVDVLWANARDSALDFYRKMGMSVVGEGFERIGLPHHLVVLDLHEVDGTDGG